MGCTLYYRGVVGIKCERVWRRMEAKVGVGVKDEAELKYD